MSICIAAVIGITYFYFLSPFSARPATTYLYIDNDDDADSVSSKLSAIARHHAMTGFNTLARHSNYPKNIRTGRYAIEPGTPTLTVFRRLKNGMQTPVSLTIPSVRTKERLAAELSKRLMADSASIATVLNDGHTCRQFGLDTATIVCLFIPNTYDIYWNISVENLLKRMQAESDRFWTAGRKEKAMRMGLSTCEVMTLASIVDEETANEAEKPMVAGMYYNRLKLRNAEYPEGMPLQADPTIKFAWKQFKLKRIYHKLLTIDSPYNTYKYAGLPPGPIRIPSVMGIDAVLNHVEHGFLYMCAKEDFSGTHNFATTYNEHLKNAARYTKALNERGIK